MNEVSFIQVAKEYLNEEVEVVTLQGNFNGRLHSVGQDVIVLESIMRGRPLKVTIRIEAVVAIYRIEFMPRGFFDFPRENEFEQQMNESSNH